MTWKARSGPCNQCAKAGPDPAGSNFSRQQLFQKHLPTHPMPARIITATSTLTLLLLLMPHATAKALRCETEGQGTDWMQASPTEGWRVWKGDAWGPSLCGRQVQTSHQIEEWRCRFGRQRHVLTYTLTDLRSGGIYRREETLEAGGGTYRLRIDDGTHVPDGGKRLKLEFSGLCVGVIGVPPASL